MRVLAVGILTTLLTLAAAVPTSEDLPQGACDPETDNHTNPPIIGGKGNSVVWYQCDRSTQNWVALQPDYDVFDGDDCNAAAQFLDDDWFGTATEGGKATLRRKNAQKEVSGVTLKNDRFTLKIEFESPSNAYKPNSIELCRVGGECCPLAPAYDQSRQGKIPREFEAFDDAAIEYGLFNKKGHTPLRFATCKNVGCGH